MLAFVSVAIRFIGSHLKSALIIACVLAIGGYIVALHLQIDSARAGEAQAKAIVDKVNAASAKALSDALANQQVAEGKVAAIERSFNDEVTKHASDVLSYRAQLDSGAQRMRVHVTGCTASDPSQGSASAGSADGASASADLAPTVASGLVSVADDDQKEIDKLSALQAYIRALQDRGYIAR
ncbi:bacteriophage Rz lysis protein [Paraburkholderia sp. BL8N3]|nr:bacteriophage Rz lysis protein [Paraburkholderia sp. BL8N3]